jgi:hypothetical protein
MKKQETETTISVLKIDHASIDVYVVGVSPLRMNRLSEKAKHELLYPSKKKNQTEKDTILKHDPMAEFLASPHRIPDPNAETLLALPATAFKKALSTAALDLPGTKKAQIARLTYVDNEFVPIYGVPLMLCTNVRMADMAHTPDIRFICALKEWAAKFTVNFVQPNLTPEGIMNLVSASGVYVGVGDGRPEKGKLSCGRFRICSPTDKDFLRICKYGGRKIQEAGMKTPSYYDQESEELYTWWTEERKRRQSGLTSKKSAVAVAAD